MLKLISYEDLDSFIQTKPVALLYISQPDCAVCHDLLPQLDQMIQERYPQINSRHLSVADLPEIAGRFTIFTAPVVIVFVDGKEYLRRARFIPLRELQVDLDRLTSLIAD